MTPIEWTDYHPSDHAAVEELHREMEAKVGRKMDLPDLDSRPILIAMVGRTNGKITHCLFAEAEMEVCAAGTHPLAPEQIAPAVQRITEVGRFYGIRIVRCYVPAVMLESPRKGRKPAIERMLRRIGFTKEKKSMTQFFKWLVTAEEPSPSDVTINSEVA